MMQSGIAPDRELLLNASADAIVTISMLHQVVSEFMIYRLNHLNLVIIVTGEVLNAKCCQIASIGVIECVIDHGFVS
jgi:hypothetical protein